MVSVKSLFEVRIHAAAPAKPRRLEFKPWGSAPRLHQSPMTGDIVAFCSAESQRSRPVHRFHCRNAAKGFARFYPTRSSLLQQPRLHQIRPQPRPHGRILALKNGRFPQRRRDPPRRARRRVAVGCARPKVCVNCH